MIYDNAAGIQVGSICTNCLVYNNTLYNNGTGSAVDADGKGTVVRNNIAYQSGSFINFGGATMHNNFTGDPGFTNIAARDFSLKPGSEARGAGDDGGDLGATPGRRGQSVPLAPRPAHRGTCGRSRSCPNPVQGEAMDILTVIQLSLLVIPSVFALGFWRGRRRRTALEHQGEALVRRTLTRQFSQAGDHLLNHLTLPCQDGTTEIDHVLVARTGIFVIEAKHYSGTIEAWGDGPSWTQHLGPYTYQFQNPLRQNYKHVKAIEQVLDFVPTAHIHSLVVFTGTATFATGLPPQVYTLQGLVDHLAHQTHQVLTMQDLHLCVGRLECQRYRLSRQTDVEHHAYLARKFGHLS